LQEFHQVKGGNKSGDTAPTGGGNAKILPLPNRLKSVSSGDSGDCGDIWGPIEKRQEVEL
jgi:hypothetical protein